MVARVWIFLVLVAATLAAPMAIAQVTPGISHPAPAPPTTFPIYHPVIAFPSPTATPRNGVVAVPGPSRIDQLTDTVIELKNEVAALQARVKYLEGMTEPPLPGYNCHFTGTLSPNDILYRTRQYKDAIRDPLDLFPDDGENMLLVRCAEPGH